MMLYSMAATNDDRSFYDEAGHLRFLDAGETVTLKWQCAKGHNVEASGAVPHGFVKVEEARMLA